MFPIPPLSVQKEIVRMLDDMAGLIDALEEELAARKKQYEWYRDRLLGMRNSEYCSVTLGEVCEFRNGYTPSKANDKFWNDGDVPWFRMDDIRVNGRILSDAIQHVTNAAVKKSGLVKPNSVVFATTATIGEHALISTEFLTNQQMTSLTVKDETVLVPKFLFYLGFDIGKSCRKIAHVGGGLPIVDSMKFRSLEVSLPPLSEQRRIVKILDNFDTLCNSMTEGLPGEIALRKQQYEFYRDKLLTFKKAV
jgi:type I restriction enzyme S subunit